MCWGVALQVQIEKTTMLNYLFNVGFAAIYLTGAIIGLVGAKTLGIGGAIGKAFLYVGLSLVSYGTALLIWTYYNIGLAVEIPSPSLADVFFLLLFLPLAGIGFLYLIKIYMPMVTRRHVIESVAIFIFSLVIIYGFAIQPQLSADVPLFTNLVNAAYPFVDSIILALSLIALRSGGGKLYKGLLIIVVGFLIQVVADVLYSTRVAHEVYWNGDIADIGYTLAAFVISYGMLQLFYRFAVVNEV